MEKAAPETLTVYFQKFKGGASLNELLETAKGEELEFLSKHIQLLSVYKENLKEEKVKEIINNMVMGEQPFGDIISKLESGDLIQIVDYIPKLQVLEQEMSKARKNKKKGQQGEKDIGDQDPDDKAIIEFGAMKKKTFREILENKQLHKSWFIWLKHNNKTVSDVHKECVDKAIKYFKKHLDDWDTL